jgi:ABC-type multidrug transport system fused ATPase/permease subunit
MFIGLTFGASVGSILPLLEAMLSPDGLHGWADRSIAEHRLGADLSHRGGEIRVTAVHDEGPAERMKLEVDDLILSVAGKSAEKPLDLYQRLASAAPNETINIEIKKASGEDWPDASVQLAASPWHWRLAYPALNIIPRGDPFRAVLWVMAALFVIRIIENLARILQEYLVQLVSLRAVMDVRREAYDKVLRLPMSHFSRPDGGVADVMSRFVQDSQAIQRGIKTLFAKTLIEPVKAITLIGIALAINWQFTLLALVLTPLAAVLIRKFGKKVRRASRKSLQAWSMMLANLEGSLFGIRVVKAYSAEGRERRRLFNIDRQLLAQQLKVVKVDAASGPILQIIGTMTASVAIVAGVWFVIQGEMSPSQFILLSGCLAGIYDPIRKLSNVWIRIQAANAGADRVFELIDLQSEEEATVDHPELPPFEREVEFRNVKFSYDSADAPALDSANLKTPKGRSVAIVGPNGSGKTTLMSLLPRFYSPQEGAVLIDGQDVGEVRLRSLRDQIAVVPQDAVLFADTVLENIRYGKKYATLEEVIDASKKAFADEFISELPKGYDDMIGEHGVNLSGGQRQRISLARAILRDAPILILDEATSQIDAESEQKIQRALGDLMKNRTTFVIAHRLSTILAADHIVVMDAGRIIDEGSHDELVARCSLYRRLYESQRN